MQKIVILVLGIIFIAAACNKDTNNEQTNNIITFTTEGFNPKTLTVKKGTTVTFTNNSSSLSWPASAPHPSHTNYPEFDPKKGTPAGQSWSFTFEKAGTWAFHDHLNATKFGSVVVTE